MPLILILNGPNLNMLGVRDPAIYGPHTLKDIEAMCAEKCRDLGFELDFRQSNHEGELVTWIQEARETIAGLVINAGAYTHTSLAIHDALELLSPVPIIEVHLSDPKRREAFRHFSYIESLAADHICGQGAGGYLIALDRLFALLRTS
jgi:3-dehydroquinate dehydratase-2